MANKDPDAWTQNDAIALRTFLSDNPKFKRVLAGRVNKITGTTMEESAMTGRQAQGFNNCIEEIDHLCQDPLPQSDDAGFIAERKR